MKHNVFKRLISSALVLVMALFYFSIPASAYYGDPTFLGEYTFEGFVSVVEPNFNNRVHYSDFQATMIAVGDGYTVYSVPNYSASFSPFYYVICPFSTLTARYVDPETHYFASLTPGQYLFNISYYVRCMDDYGALAADLSVADVPVHCLVSFNETSADGSTFMRTETVDLTFVSRTSDRYSTSLVTLSCYFDVPDGSTFSGPFTFSFDYPRSAWFNMTSFSYPFTCHFEIVVQGYSFAPVVDVDFATETTLQEILSLLEQYFPGFSSSDSSIASSLDSILTQLNNLSKISTNTTNSVSYLSSILTTLGDILNKVGSSSGSSGGSDIDYTEYLSSLVESLERLTSGLFDSVDGNLLYGDSYLGYIYLSLDSLNQFASISSTWAEQIGWMLPQYLSNLSELSTISSNTTKILQALNGFSSSSGNLEGLLSSLLDLLPSLGAPSVLPDNELVVSPDFDDPDFTVAIPGVGSELTFWSFVKEAFHSSVGIMGMVWEVGAHDAVFYLPDTIRSVTDWLQADFAEPEFLPLEGFAAAASDSDPASDDTIGEEAFDIWGY